jgi:O-succinylbenzoate synthase
MEFRPFRVRLTTRFRGVTERSGVLIRGRAADGSDAWGEYSPFADYDSERASRWWAAAMEAARGEWPAPVRATVAVNSIVPQVDPAEAALLAVAGGCVVAKVKVGGPGSSLAGDRARVEAVAAAVLRFGGPRARVRVDANGAWDVDEAVRAIAELDLGARAGGVDGLEYVEQPCATIEGLAAVRRRVSVPIAADESVRIPTDPLAVAHLGAADILVLKVAPLGGVRACLDLAEAAGLPVVVSSAMETSIGLGAGLALALALPDLPYACGLGTGALLKDDVVAHPLVPRDGTLTSIPVEVIV